MIKIGILLVVICAYVLFINLVGRRKKLSIFYDS